MGPRKVKVKVSLSTELKAQFEAIARQKGVPLSWLFLDAAIQIHLNPKRSRPQPKLTPPPTPAPLAPKQKERSFARPVEPVISTGEEVHLEYLVARFGGDRVLKARLCQLGGRDGALFQGSITHARKVEEVTMRLDPEHKPWMPINPQRTRWAQMSAQAYVEAILTKK